MRSEAVIARTRYDVLTGPKQPLVEDRLGKYYVYMMSNLNNTVIYMGMTNNLLRRVQEHKSKLIDGFTKQYNATKLVYYEVVYDPWSAINREKQLKAGSRKRKIHLIETINKNWDDLYGEL